MKKKNIVGGNLKKIRANMGLTQEEVALRSGLSQGYINQLESGKRMFTQKSLEQIAKALNFPIADLFREKTVESVIVSEDTAEFNQKKPPSKKEILALLTDLPPRLKKHYFSLLKLEKELWGKYQL